MTTLTQSEPMERVHLVTTELRATREDLVDTRKQLAKLERLLLERKTGLLRG